MIRWEQEKDPCSFLSCYKVHPGLTFTSRFLYETKTHRLQTCKKWMNEILYSTHINLSKKCIYLSTQIDRHLYCRATELVYEIVRDNPKCPCCSAIQLCIKICRYKNILGLNHWIEWQRSEPDKHNLGNTHAPPLIQNTLPLMPWP